MVSYPPLPGGLARRPNPKRNPMIYTSGKDTASDLTRLNKRPHAMLKTEADHVAGVPLGDVPGLNRGTLETEAIWIVSAGSNLASDQPTTWEDTS
jgi:hypothetical protein